MVFIGGSPRLGVARSDFNIYIAASNSCMKKQLLFSALLFSIAGLRPFVGNAGFHPLSSDPLSTNLAEVRTGAWPINLERWVDRRDTSYVLIFRDQAVMQGNVLDTLPFANLVQLRYFEKALTTLKSSETGEIATFKDYSLKRADTKFDGVSYILRYQDGQTEFKQPEADILRSTIKKL